MSPVLKQYLAGKKLVLEVWEAAASSPNPTKDTLVGLVKVPMDGLLGSIEVCATHF